MPFQAVSIVGPAVGGTHGIDGQGLREQVLQSSEHQPPYWSGVPLASLMVDSWPIPTQELGAPSHTWVPGGKPSSLTENETGEHVGTGVPPAPVFTPPAPVTTPPVPVTTLPAPARPPAPDAPP